MAFYTYLYDAVSRDHGKLVGGIRGRHTKHGRNVAEPGGSTPSPRAATQAERASSLGRWPPAHLVIAVAGKAWKAQGEDIQWYWQRLGVVHLAQLRELELCGLAWRASDFRSIQRVFHRANVCSYDSFHPDSVLWRADQDSDAV